jgi:bifunctional DNA-binding transcriptional regulator/antitoxin component of YhaV-PrlF toxin-antitoxin module
MTEIVLPKTIEYANLRSKNQLTLPERIASELGAKQGDRFAVFLQAPDEVVFRRTGSSAYGKYPGLWGNSDEEIQAHVRGLRDEWKR